MFELKIPVPEFVQAALRAGAMSNFEGAILLLARGLSAPLERELINAWDDLDDITHKGILVLTFGVTSKCSGITAWDMQRRVLAEGVSTAYPPSDMFEKRFEQLLMVADHVPHVKIHRDHNGPIFDSHGTTDIRCALNIRERQLPSLFIVFYGERVEYVIELGSGQIQLSPVILISEIARNLDDRTYKHQDLMDNLSRLLLEKASLQNEIKKKQRSLTLGQLESVVIHIHQTLVDAPDDLKDIGSKLVDFLSGRDEDADTVHSYESRVIKYALSLNESAFARRLPMKLQKAIERRLRNESLASINRPQLLYEDFCRIKELTQSETSKLKDHILNLDSKINHLRNKRESLDTKNAFKPSVDKTLNTLGLNLRVKEDGIQWLHGFYNCQRLTFSVGRDVPETIQYDIALSFASEDRPYVEEVAEALTAAGIRVFYDRYETVRLWGRDLYAYLDEIYRKRAKLCVIFISRQYGEKLWTSHERRSAQARAFFENREYILPVRFDETDIPGIPETVGYIDARETTPNRVAELIIQKLRILGPSL